MYVWVIVLLLCLFVVFVWGVFVGCVDFPVVYVVCFCFLFPFSMSFVY